MQCNYGPSCTQLFPRICRLACLCVYRLGKHFAAYDIEIYPVVRWNFSAEVNVRNMWESYLVSILYVSHRLLWMSSNVTFLPMYCFFYLCCM